MRLISLDRKEDLVNLMRGIGVDPYGIKIMSSKAMFFLLKIESLNTVAANILKQEMLSLGAELALSRNSLNLSSRVTDCLAMGTLAQFSDLSEKLKRQQFGLAKIGKEIKETIAIGQKKRPVRLKAGKHSLSLGKAPCLMAVVNITPDSFSGDGLYGSSNEKIIFQAEKMAGEGADIIDLGGESSRPGARPVSLKEELSRVIPVLKKIVRKVKVPVSVDTQKPEVAKAALESGASIINDISGLRNNDMAKIIARHNAAVVIMHMQGNPRTMQVKPSYSNLMDDIYAILSLAIKKALDFGIRQENIIIDPGIGFGKTVEDNLEILKRLSELRSLNSPILVGVSRKSFIGKITGCGVNDRIAGTLASCVLARINGADIFRVHDVKEARQALLVTNRIIE